MNRRVRSRRGTAMSAAVLTLVTATTLIVLRSVVGQDRQPNTASPKGNGKLPAPGADSPDRVRVDRDRVVTLSGLAAPVQGISVVAPIDGRVLKMAANGDRVQAGDDIVQMDPGITRQAVRRAREEWRTVVRQQEAIEHECSQVLGELQGLDERVAEIDKQLRDLHEKVAGAETELRRARDRERKTAETVASVKEHRRHLAAAEESLPLQETRIHQAAEAVERCQRETRATEQRLKRSEELNAVGAISRNQYATDRGRLDTARAAELESRESLSQAQDKLEATHKKIRLQIAEVESLDREADRENKDVAAMTRLATASIDQLSTEIHNASQAIQETRTLISEREESLAILKDKLSETRDRVRDAQDKLHSGEGLLAYGTLRAAAGGRIETVVKRPGLVRAGTVLLRIIDHTRTTVSARDGD